MTLIRKQNAVDIYAAHDGRFVVIREEDGFYDPQNGETVDVFINIDVTHIDTVIDALQAAKKEILDR